MHHKSDEEARRNLRNAAFDTAAQAIALALAPRGLSITKQQFELEVNLGYSEAVYVFPSTEDDFPVGVGVHSWDRTGGLASEQVLALCHDGSQALAVVESILASSAPAPTDLDLLVDARSTQVGDVIESLGFTVEKIRTHSTASRGLLTTCYDGERELPLTLGYEIKVVRGWDGYRDFLSDSQTLLKVGQAIKERIDTDVDFDAESLLAWADEWKVDLRSCDLTDGEFEQVAARATAQAVALKDDQQRAMRGLAALQELAENLGWDD